MFGANFRVTPKQNTNSIFQAMKKANFSSINFGLESGNDRIRKEILNRYYSNADIIRVINQAKENGLRTLTYNLIGLPGETLTKFKDTIACNRACLPDAIKLHVFFPYPGTKLYHLCKNKGMLNYKIDERQERYQTILDLKGFSRNQIQKEFIWFNYNVYRGFKPWYKLIATVIFTKFITTHPLLHLFYGELESHTYLKYIKRIISRTFRLR